MIQWLCEVALALAVGAMILSAPGAVGLPFTVTDLGGTGAIGRAINDMGQVAGWSEFFVPSLGYTSTHAALWTNGSMADLGTLGGFQSNAKAINSLGQVVGWSFTSTGTVHAFLWTRGTMTDLGALGLGYSAAYGVNDRGQVVGGSTVSMVGTDLTHAVLWQDGAIVDLGTLGGDISVALGINNQGQIVGWSSTVSGSIHAFLWSNGTMGDLGTLPSIGWSKAFAVNGAGQVVGVSGDHAVVWTPLSAGGYAIRDLGTLGGPVSGAIAINDLGEVVGWSLARDSKAITGPVIVHAFLWAGGSMADLGTLPGAMHSAAYGINDEGQVSGASGDHLMWETGLGPVAYGEAALWTPPAPIQGVEVLKARVDALVISGILNQGQGLSLESKLNLVLLKVPGQPCVAVQAIKGFADEVSAYVRSGRLTTAQGLPLIELADAILGQLSAACR